MSPEEFIVREQEVLKAQKEFPKDEMWEAYEKWKRLRGEVATPLMTGDPSIEEAKLLLRQSAKRPCPSPGCDGEQLLESVCGGCVEGKAGYKSKWTCEKCLHRDLSKKEYMEWLRELASSSSRE